MLKHRPSENGQRYLRAIEVANYFGVTTMGLWRWRKDPKLGFPKPHEVNGTPYFDLGEIESWMRKRVASR